MTANRAASIRARLKQHTDTVKQDFNLTLTWYGLERLLYRLSVSEHAPNFLLKGALLFQLWYGQPHRPTRDADLLGFGPDDVLTLVGVFHDSAMRSRRQPNPSPTRPCCPTCPRRHCAPTPRPRSSPRSCTP